MHGGRRPLSQRCLPTGACQDAMFLFAGTRIYRSMSRCLSGWVAGSFRCASSSGCCCHQWDNPVLSALRCELYGWSPALAGQWGPLHSGPEHVQWRGEMEMSIRNDWLLQRTMETQTDELHRWGIDADAAKTCRKRLCSLGSDLENNHQPCRNWQCRWWVWRAIYRSCIASRQS